MDKEKGTQRDIETDRQTIEKSEKQIDKEKGTQTEAEKQTD